MNSSSNSTAPVTHEEVRQAVGIASLELKEDIRRVYDRVEAGEKRLEARLEQMAQRLSGRIDGLESRMDRMEHNMMAMFSVILAKLDIPAPELL